jgi:hypothetical protein
MVEDLSIDLFYLARGPSDRSGVVTVEGPAGRWLPVFTTRRAAQRLCRRAPAGVVVASAPADDPRAREELLLAGLQAGAEVLALDPGPADGPSPTHPPASVRAALAYVRSLRTGTACL